MSRIVGALMAAVLVLTIFVVAADADTVKLTSAEAKAKMLDYEKRIAALEDESAKLEARKKDLPGKILPDIGSRLSTPQIKKVYKSTLMSYLLAGAGCPASIKTGSAGHRTSRGTVHGARQNIFLGRPPEHR